MFENWMEFFRAGDHPQGPFSNQDIAEIAEVYDPKLREAPAVIGHPKMNSPAFAWVEALKAQGPSLFAKFKKVFPKFKEGVEQGLWPKRSAAFTRDVIPGKWYLRHIGFLGAKPPQIDGMADGVDFSSVSENFTVEFTAIAEKKSGHKSKPAQYADVPESEFADPVNWKYPLNTADRVHSALSYWANPDDRAEYSADEIKLITGRILKATKKFGIETDPKKWEFSENKAKEDNDMTKEEIQALLDEQQAKFNAEIEKLKQAKAAEFSAHEKTSAEREKTLAAEVDRLKSGARHAEIGRRLDKLQDEGKVTPGMLTFGLAEFIAGLDQATEVQFSQDKAATKETPAAFMWRFLETLPPAVTFGHLAVKPPDEKDPLIKAMVEGTTNQG